MRQRFLSIIIAAYQAEAYIEKCLDSILQAGCQGIEILVVLGGSKDRTDAICRSYEQKGLLTCAMQEKRGLSNARNCGMRMAKGEYLTFVDADDWLDTERFALCVEYLKNVLQKRPYDVVVNDFRFADKEGKLLAVNRQIANLAKAQAVNQQIEVTGQQAESQKNAATARLLADDKERACAMALVRSKGTFWNMWRYIFRTDYLRKCGRRFLEGHGCEDLEFAVRTFLDTGQMAFLHMPYYNYCPVRPQSLMNTKNLKSAADFWMVERRLLRLCGQDASPLAEAVTEKLKELAVLNLPDIWEVGRNGRHAAMQGYRRLLQEMGLPERKWQRIAVYLCRTGMIAPVSLILYLVKYLRRAYRYHRPGNSRARQ